MPLAFFVFLCCVTLFAQSHAAVSELTVGNYSLISSTRVGRTTWQYVYRATVTNSGTTDIPNVTATATSAVTGLTVVSGTITFGDVPPGKAVSSSTTFTVSVDRSYSLNQADLTWIITSTIATGSIGATGGALATPDGVTTFNIPAGALQQNTNFTIAQSTNYPPVGGLTGAYELYPDGLIFSTPISLSIKYDPDSIPASIDQNQLKVAYVYNNDWTVVNNTMVDTVNHIVTAQIPHLSTYAVVVGGKPFGTVLNPTGEPYTSRVLVYSNGAPSNFSGTFNCGGSSPCGSDDAANTGYEWQCVEFVNRYYLQVYGKNVRYPSKGNANDYYKTAATRGLTPYPNGGSTPPQIGDIIVSAIGSDATCLNPAKGQRAICGHVAVVTNVQPNVITVAQQNYLENVNDAEYPLLRDPLNPNHVFPFDGKSGSYIVTGWLRLAESPSTHTISLPKTGQTACYDTAGTIIPCTGTGQDGEIQAGVAWPSPRFNDNGDGTVTDKLTGLMWLKDGNCFGMQTWYGALDKIAGFNGSSGNYNCQAYTAHYSDWRMPNINEAESLVHPQAEIPSDWLNSQGFVNVQYNWYWSSTTRSYLPSVTESAWDVSMMAGWVSSLWKGSGLTYVWPVRAGQFNTTDPNYPANMWKTGQKTSYYAGDDGAKQAGVSWPSGRFTDHGDGTINDNLTGLVWAKNAATPVVDACPLGTNTWQNALDLVKCLSANKYLGYGDWRLPNRNELYSLLDFSQSYPALPSGHPFVVTGTNSYWTSTSLGAATYWNTLAYLIDIAAEGAFRGDKSNQSNYNYQVWPVRAGTQP